MNDDERFLRFMGERKDQPCPDDLYDAASRAIKKGWVEVIGDEMFLTDKGERAFAAFPKPPAEAKGQTR